MKENIHQATDKENPLRVFAALNYLGLKQNLPKAGFVKRSCSLTVPIRAVFNFVFSSCFNFVNLFHRLTGKESRDLPFGKTTVYDFMNNPKFNWEKLALLTAKKLYDHCRPLTSHQGCFIIDDTIVPRPRSKKVECLSRVFDHVNGKTVKGFFDLTLCWTEGTSLIPVNHRLIGSNKRKNKLCQARYVRDKRTRAYKLRTEVFQSKASMCVKMVAGALAAGIKADYVLMDSWFIYQTKLVKNLRSLGVEVIGMVKQAQQKFRYNNTKYTLSELYQMLPKTDKDPKGSLVV